MSDVLTGIAFVVLAAAVLIWRTFQDARAVADRPDGALVPVKSRASGMVVGDFSGTAGGGPAGAGDGSGSTSG